MSYRRLSEDDEDDLPEYLEAGDADSAETLPPVLAPIPTTVILSSVPLTLTTVGGLPDSVRYELRDEQGAFVSVLGVALSSVNDTWPVICVAPSVIGTYRVVAVAVYGLVELVSDAVEWVVTSI